MAVEAPATRAQRMTMDEFVSLVERDSGRHYKFDARGDVIAVSPKVIHGVVQGRVVSLLLRWLEGGALPEYWAATEVAHELGDWRCRPDVVLLRADSEPIPVAPPLLAVEIRSESNPRSELREKARRYLAHGAQMVWLVYPETGALELYRADGTMQTLRGDERIEGGATLPGLSVAASALFPPQADRAR